MATPESVRPPKPSSAVSLRSPKAPSVRQEPPSLISSISTLEIKLLRFCGNSRVVANQVVNDILLEKSLPKEPAASTKGVLHHLAYVCTKTSDQTLSEMAERLSERFVKPAASEDHRHELMEILGGFKEYGNAVGPKALGIVKLEDMNDAINEAVGGEEKRIKFKIIPSALFVIPKDRSLQLCAVARGLHPSATLWIGRYESDDGTRLDFTFRGRFQKKGIPEERHMFVGPIKGEGEGVSFLGAGAKASSSTIVRLNDILPVALEASMAKIQFAALIMDSHVILVNVGKADLFTRASYDLNPS